MTDLYRLDTQIGTLSRKSLILLGDRLTVGLTISAFIQSFQCHVIQILPGFSRVLTAICIAFAPPVPGGAL